MSLERLETNKVKLTIQVDTTRFNEAMAVAYKKNAGRFKVAGFRPGKAPRKVIETYYGEGVFYEYAFDEVYPEAYDEAVKAEGIVPVDKPDISIEKIGGDEPLVFTATVTTYPDVKLGAYKGIEVESVEYNVTDAEVDAEMDRARERAARFVDANRPAKDGDNINMDYSGRVDGELFEGGTAKEQFLTIGSGRFIPGFEEGLVGMSVGDEKDITVTFPEEYHAPDLAGKPAVFTVKINGIKQKELPDLDDEFAKDVSEYDTLSEYKTSIRKNLEDAAKERAEQQKEEAAVGIVAKGAEIEIPEVMIERRLGYLLEDMEYRLRSQGLSFDQYFEMTGTSANDLIERYKPDAEQLVRNQLVLDEIVKQEGIKATEKELDAEIEPYAKQQNQPIKDYKAALKEDEREYIEALLARRNAVKLILDEAKYVAPKKKSADKPKTASKAAEKPATAKKPSEAAAKKPADTPAKKPASAAAKKPADAAAKKPADTAAKKPAAAKPKSAAKTPSKAE